MGKIAFLLFALAIVCVGRSPAFAQTAPKWQGPYVGGTLGLGFNAYNFDDQDYFESYDRTTYNRTSLVPGVKGGYDWRFGSVVTGVAAEYDYDLGARVYHAPTNVPADSYAGNLTSMFALTGRAGLLANDQGMFYLSFGGVYAKDYQQFSSAAANWTRSDWTLGVLAGLGAEFGLTEHLSLTGEYQHGYFVPRTEVATSAGKQFSYGLSPALDLFRVGINYRF